MSVMVQIGGLSIVLPDGSNVVSERCVSPLSRLQRLTAPCLQAVGGGRTAQVSTGFSFKFFLIFRFLLIPGFCNRGGSLLCSSSQAGLERCLPASPLHPGRIPDEFKALVFILIADGASSNLKLKKVNALYHSDNDRPIHVLNLGCKCHAVNLSNNDQIMVCCMLDDPGNGAAAPAVAPPAAPPAAPHVKGKGRGRAKVRGA